MAIATASPNPNFKMESPVKALSAALFLATLSFPAFADEHALAENDYAAVGDEAGAGSDRGSDGLLCPKTQSGCRNSRPSAETFLRCGGRGIREVPLSAPGCPTVYVYCCG